jgi:hypothetical protein
MGRTFPKVLPIPLSKGFKKRMGYGVFMVDREKF